MGIADRDYARPIPPAGSRGATDQRARVGRVSPLSVNTWLVIINVAVFLIGHFVLGRVQMQVSTGVVANGEVDVKRLRDGVVATWITRTIPQTQIPAHPIFDPASQVKDARGNVVRDPAGNPIYSSKPIGWSRFTYMPILHAVGHFSTGKGFFEFQFWRFITFQFLHADITHLLFNMMGLLFVGGLVEEYLGRKRYLAFYLASGLFGAVGYLILNTLGYAVLRSAPQWHDWLPALLFDDTYTPLIGASAGVFGVLMAAAYIAPHAMVAVMFVIPMKLRTAVYIFLAVATINLLRGGQNAGGDAAHVGGAIAGAILVRRAHWLRDFFDVMKDSRAPSRPPGGPSAATIDRILEKVQQDGLESLTPSEREALRRETMAAREQYGD